MSDDLYQTLLRWRRGRGGIAKDHGKIITIPADPPLVLRVRGGVDLDALAWAPFYFAEIQVRYDSQRSMEKDEIAAARALLAELVA